MYLINAGKREVKDSKLLERKGQSNDFEAAKKKADKLLNFFRSGRSGRCKNKRMRLFPSEGSR